METAISPAGCASPGDVVWWHGRWVTISGLTTNACYTVYLYTQGDGQKRPGSGTDWIPNYTINGSIIYTPTIAPGFKRFIQGGMTLANTNAFPNGLICGNYIRWNNGIASNGVITISYPSDQPRLVLAISSH